MFTPFDAVAPFNQTSQPSGAGVSSARADKKGDVRTVNWSFRRTNDAQVADASSRTRDAGVPVAALRSATPLSYRMLTDGYPRSRSGRVPKAKRLKQWSACRISTAASDATRPVTRGPHNESRQRCAEMDAKAGFAEPWWGR